MKLGFLYHLYVNSFVGRSGRCENVAETWKRRLERGEYTRNVVTSGCDRGNSWGKLATILLGEWWTREGRSPNFSRSGRSGNEITPRSHAWLPRSIRFYHYCTLTFPRPIRFHCVSTTFLCRFLKIGTLSRLFSATLKGREWRQLFSRSSTSKQDQWRLTYDPITFYPTSPRFEPRFHAFFRSGRAWWGRMLSVIGVLHFDLDLVW